jgi:hypothetical protein
MSKEKFLAELSKQRPEKYNFSKVADLLSEYQEVLEQHHNIESWVDEVLNAQSALAVAFDSGRGAAVNMDAGFVQLTMQLDELGVNWHDISEFDEMIAITDRVEEIRNEAYEHLKSN